MANSKQYELYGFETDDPPVRMKTEDDLIPFSVIDQPTRNWLDSLENIWSLWKKSVTVTQMLHEYFGTAPNPYLSTLRILVNAKDFYHVKSKSSLAFTVIEEFSNWIVPRKDKFDGCLCVELKVAAFRLIIKQKNVQLTKTVSEIYEFTSDKKHFMGFIIDMLESKNYKDAGVNVEMLKLQNEFDDPEVLLMPLVLQNKTTIAEDLMKNQPELQIKFVSYLDNLLTHDNISNAIDRYIYHNNIPDVKFQYSQNKSISKLVARLAKLYNVPHDVCPNLNKKRGEGAIQFLIYKRYVEASLSVESWREMAKEAIGSDSSLQVEVIRSLANVNDPAEAYYFVQFYSISRDEWPWNVRQYVDENPDSVNNGEVNDALDENSWETEDQISYHTLNLPRKCITIIDNAKSFEDFLVYGLKNVNVVGIDSEWKPTFGIKKPELALMQIATHSHIYILDVTVLGYHNQDLWKELGTALFNNKRILKLGFGIAHDITILRESFPVLSNIRACGEGYLDLSHLWNKLLKEDFVFPYKGDVYFTSKNLSKLVELSLGQRLKKTDQFSNWERRPLRESQITYAALDAYCLLEVYDILAKQCGRLGIPFHEVCAHVNDNKSFTDLNGPKSSKNESKKPNNMFNLSNKQAFWTSVQQSSSRQPHYAHDQNTEPVDDATQSCSTAPDQVHPEELLDHQQSQPQHPCQSNINSWPRLQHRKQRQHVQPRLFVCDSMLGGLARQMRKCGIDTLHFLRDRGGELSLRAAHDKQGVLLTRHNNFYRFKEYLPPGYCYNVSEVRVEDQLDEIIHYYNIKVNEADVFSRCQLCNSNEFVYVSKDTMTGLIQSHTSRKNSPNSTEVGQSSSAEVCNHWDTEEKAFQQMQTNNEKQFPSRSWILSYGCLNVTNCSTKYNVKVQIDRVPPNMLRYHYYVCERCGKVYWYGSHIERAFNGNLRKILN
ncbi:exonuclease mut-7 homolog [Copidosoma floridanum]|uniref:exonuclease mut-7 homolog n=1 Tax=Copidosoma floridanum TaxID=29053 RepID=UPI0006C9DA50|nr:exonuclease mut-7 homolog [Copidosoma floridanum]